MAQSTLAGVVTACGVIALLMTAVGGLITAIAARRTSLATQRATLRTETVVDEVHTIVNQQRTDAQNYQRALIKALERAGVAVPDDQSAGPDQPVDK
jgi:hypothetical protein